MKNIIKSEILKLIKEERNYHYNRSGREVDIDNLASEYSDNIYVMRGRGTGHFGSGMYFSTYNIDGWNKEEEIPGYNEKHKNDKGLIRVEPYLYSIDLDEIPNMFKVRTEQLGEVLFETLKNANNFFYAYYDVITRNNTKQDPMMVKVYRYLRRNFKQLGIEFMSFNTFRELTTTAVNDFNSKENSTRRGSFSTRIMTELGFSGVDVSGVPRWDNTTHGSVVYDIADFKNKVHKVENNPNIEPRITKSLDDLDPNDTGEEARVVIGNSSLTNIILHFNEFSQGQKKLALRKISEFLKGDPDPNDYDDRNNLNYIRDNIELEVIYCKHPLINASSDSYKINKVMKSKFPDHLKINYLKKAVLNSDFDISEFRYLDTELFIELGLITDEEDTQMLYFNDDGDYEGIFNKFKKRVMGL